MHDSVKVDGNTSIRSLAKILEHLLCLLVKDLAGVFSEGVDVEEVCSLFSLELPALPVSAEDSCDYFDRDTITIKGRRGDGRENKQKKKWSML